MKPTILYSFVMFTISSLFMSGCSDITEVSPESSTDAPKQEVVPSENSNYIEYVSPLPADAPIYKVATEASYPPFVLQDSFGKTNGLDVDLIRAIGETQGFKVEINTMPWEAVYPNILNDKYDIAMSGISIQEDTQEKFGHSNPYLKDTVYIISKENSSIYSINDLSEKTVGAQLGVSYVDIAKSMTNIPLVEQPTIFSLFEDMVQNKTDAFLSDKAVIFHMAQQFPDIHIKYTKAVEKSHYIGFSTKKDNQEVLTKINAGLAEIKKNGRYDEINKKWFGENADEMMVK